MIYLYKVLFYIYIINIIILHQTQYEMETRREVLDSPRESRAYSGERLLF